MRTYSQQKAGLTRAKNRVNRHLRECAQFDDKRAYAQAVEALRREVKRTVDEWNDPAWSGYGRVMWPDDWNRWRVTLQDYCGWDAWYQLTGER